MSDRELNTKWKSTPWCLCWYVSFANCFSQVDAPCRVYLWQSTLEHTWLHNFRRPQMRCEATCPSKSRASTCIAAAINMGLLLLAENASSFVLLCVDFRLPVAFAKDRPAILCRSFLICFWKKDNLYVLFKKEKYFDPLVVLRKWIQKKLSRGLCVCFMMLLSRSVLARWIHKKSTAVWWPQTQTSSFGADLLKDGRLSW